MCGTRNIVFHKMTFNEYCLWICPCVKPYLVLLSLSWLYRWGKQAQNSCMTCQAGKCRSRESNTCEGQPPRPVLLILHHYSARNAVLPGVKAVWTDYEILLYPECTCRTMFLIILYFNRIQTQVQLRCLFFFYSSCFYVGKICLITRVIHRYILVLKYPNKTVVYRAGGKIPLGFLPHSWSHSLSYFWLYHYQQYGLFLPDFS